MKKIPTLFVRLFKNGKKSISKEVTPGCEWVLNGEGLMTQKHDGTCCMFDEEGKFFKRYTYKSISQKNVGHVPPSGFIPATEIDDKTGKQEGWIPVTAKDKWHNEALENFGGIPEPGTYELCGPKVQGNPEGIKGHRLIKHGSVPLEINDGSGEFKHWTFFALQDFMQDECQGEGVVWHHPDGRMCKLKVSDFISEALLHKKWMYSGNKL